MQESVLECSKEDDEMNNNCISIALRRDKGNAILMKDFVIRVECIMICQYLNKDLNFAIIDEFWGTISLIKYSHIYDILVGL